MTYVYFIANADRTAIKIGVSDDPLKRLSDLQIGSHLPLSLIACVPGDERYERAIHERFAGLRESGEWHRNEGDLAALVGILASVPFDVYKPEPRVRARRRDKKEEMLPTDEERAEWAARLDEWYAVIKSVSDKIGYRQIAAALGVKTYMVVQAVNRRNGRKFPSEWMGVWKDVCDREALALVGVATCRLFGMPDDGLEQSSGGDA